MVIRNGDIIAKVGKLGDVFERVMGRHGMRSVNENVKGWRNSVILMRWLSLEPHFKEIHKLTWVSPDGKTKNQIDHKLVSGKFRTSVIDQSHEISRCCQWRFSWKTSDRNSKEHHWGKTLGGRWTNKTPRQSHMKKVQYTAKEQIQVARILEPTNEPMNQWTRRRRTKN